MMSQSLQRIDARVWLSRVSVFTGLDTDQLSRLASGAREMLFERGVTVVRKDEQCNGLFLVVFGKVQLSFLSSQGDEKTLDILGQGDTFCESTMFLSRPYSMFAQALTDCVLLHIDKADILAELEKDLSFARRFIDRLSLQLSNRTADLESYLLHTGRQRFIQYLLREIAEGNACFERGVNAPSVTLATTKGILASRLNLTQEHFSRVLHDLAQTGLLAVKGAKINVQDLMQLRMFSA